MLEIVRLDTLKYCVGRGGYMPGAPNITRLLTDCESAWPEALNRLIEAVYPAKICNQRELRRPEPRR